MFRRALPVAVGLCVVVSSLVLAVGPPPRPSAEVQRLFDQLGDDDLETRRAAMKKLEGLGEPVVLSLRKMGRTHADVDVRLRAHIVAGAIEAKLYGEVRRFTGHTDGVITVAVSPDGKTLASGAWMNYTEHVIRLWDVKTGKNTQSLKGHTNGVGALAFLPGGKQLLSGGTDRTLRVWDLEKGTELRKLIGHPGGLNQLAVSSDGKTAVSCCNGSTWLYVWDIEKGKLLRYLQGHAQVGRGVAFVPGQARCLSASFDGTVRLWDTKSGKELAKFLHGRPAWFVAVRPDGQQAASVGEDGQLRIWDLKTYKLLHTVEAHTQGIHGVAYSPDGKRVLTCSYENTVRLWDAATGKALQIMEGHTAVVGAVAFLPDGQHAVSGSYDKTLRLWRLKR